MNKQEAIESIKKISDDLLEVKFVSLESVIDIVSQIHEPQKPVIPKFVAEWIEELKKSHSNLAWVWQVYPNEPKIKKWLDSNTEKFMRAWLDGYTVEKEPLYTVEIPDPNSYVYYRYLSRNDNGICIDASNDAKWKQKKRNQFTESEIKQDFEWAWQFAVPVEEK